jgi:hypothetical protein
MSHHRRLGLGVLAAVALGSLASMGCQTPPVGLGGMTLPSPYYLDHYPQYLAQDPPFPLQRELDSMMDPDMGRRAAPGGTLPAPLPAVPGQLPQPTPAVGGAPAPAPAAAPAPAKN